MPTFRENVMTKKELADYAGISVSTVDRGLGECLQPFKFAKQVYYSRPQVERHFASVLENHGRCDGRCEVQATPERSFRRGSRFKLYKNG